MSGAAGANLESLMETLPKEVPELTQAKDIRFHGTMDPNGSAGFSVTFRPGPGAEIKSLAGKLSEALRHAQREPGTTSSDAQVDHDRIKFFLNVGTGGK